MRRNDIWTVKKWIYPILAFLAAFILWKEGRAETVRGIVKQSAFVQVRFAKGPLIQFTTKFDLPDIPSREWW